MNSTLPSSRVRNDTFNRHTGFELGRPRYVLAAWQLVKIIFFLSAFPWPSALKTWWLRRFGARIGQNVYWKPRVNIHIPWKLTVGAHTWIGEEVCLVNFAPVTIGAHCCLSQRSFICSGNHDYRSPDMRYRHAPIILEDGVWIGAMAFVGPGVTLGSDAVVSAGTIVTQSLKGFSVYAGNPCRAVRPRWPENQDKVIAGCRLHVEG